jgi:ADP-dependent NAD(P)H-hydrate dehydratase
MEALNSQFLRMMRLPEHDDGGKEQRGNVLVVGGSKEVPGGALLAGIAALRSGAGRLQIAMHEENASLIAVSVPEARVLALPHADIPGGESSPVDQLAGFVKRADAVLLGPGLADDRSTAVLARTIFGVAGKAKVIFDAGALKTLRRGVVAAELQKVSAITPHAGEMAGLMDAQRSDVEADMQGLAQRAASAFDTVVALKGARTIIVRTKTPCNVTGTPVSVHQDLGTYLPAS